VIRVVDGLDNECDEQALDLVAGEWDQLTWPGVVGVFVGANDGEEGVGGGGQGDVVVPAGPGAALDENQRRTNAGVLDENQRRSPR